MCLSKNEEEIEAIARKWASVISDKYVRQQAEEAARIALRHGIKDLPELREADLGKISKYHGARASFQAGMTDELPSIIRVNKRGYRGWKKLMQMPFDMASSFKTILCCMNWGIT